MQQIINEASQSPLNTTIKPVATPEAGRKPFLNYIHNFRGIAILYVIAAHPLMKWEEGDPVQQVLYFLFQNSTTMFIFIAGYLFQHLAKSFEYKTYLGKKFQNVICPYLIVSIPIIVYRVIFKDIPGFTTEVHPDFASFSTVHQVSYYLLHGAHMQQLWFVPMVTLFYLGSPLLIYIDRHPRLYWLLVPLLFVSIMIQRPALAETFKMAAHFLSAYVFGMFLGHYKDSYLEFAKKYWWLIIVLITSAILLNCYLPAKFYDPIDYIQKLLFCCLYIYLLWKLDKYVPKFLGTLATLSFGIYFLHYYFILLERRISYQIYGHEMPGTLLNWIGSYLFMLLPTVALLLLLKKLLGNKSKYFIGC
jgi:surface polysaccharide O-acyltransferase-like enzyme